MSYLNTSRADVVVVVVVVVLLLPILLSRLLLVQLVACWPLASRELSPSLSISTVLDLPANPLNVSQFFPLELQLVSTREIQTLNSNCISCTELNANHFN